jgi:hypothetical protein
VVQQPQAGPPGHPEARNLSVAPRLLWGLEQEQRTKATSKVEGPLQGDRSLNVRIVHA